MFPREMFIFGPSELARNTSKTAHIKKFTNFLLLNTTQDFLVTTVYKCGRRGGLMVSALDSGSGGPGSSPSRGTALCSWARYFTLIVPLSTQVYKSWVPANLLLGVTLRWTSIPSRGE